MSVTIRTARLADVDTVLRLWDEAGAEPTHTDDVRSLGALVGNDTSALIVAEDDHAIVGSVIAAWDGWRGSIYRLAVAPPYRRRGVGGRLVREAETWLSEAGAVRLQAIVVETDRTATAFWRASGWEQQEERLRFVKG